jgi:hypothetical protein
LRGWVVLTAWILVTLLPVPQLLFATREQRAEVDASRLAGNLSSLLQAGGVATGFALSTRQRVAWIETHALATRLAANIAAAQLRRPLDRS